MIDETAINELRTMVGPKFNMIIQTYLDNGDGFIARISDGIHKGDKVLISRTAHAFKSATGQVGALVLEEYLSDLEENAEKSEIKYSQEIFKALKAEYDVVRFALQNIIV